jgi:hypothetical protein
MMVHLLAIVGLAVLCGIWVVVQLSAGEKAPGAEGQCGACSQKEECDE